MHPLVTAPPAIEDPRSQEPREFHPNASRPLPPLRPVADFVGLPTGGRTLSLESKFAIAEGGALGWLAVCVVLGLAFGGRLASVVSWPYAVLLLASVVWIPAATAAFRCLALILDDPPALARVRPGTPVTVILAGVDPIAVVTTLAYLGAQDYDGPLRVVVVDHSPSGLVAHEARRVAGEVRLAVDLARADPASELDPRNIALGAASTPLVLAVRAGVCLHPSAVRVLAARLESCGSDTVGATAHALVRNRRDGDAAELHAADYALEIDARQRVEGLFPGPLVSDGTCTLYRTDALRAVNGWPSAPANDVVVTWRFLERGWRVVHESLAVVFTSEIVTLGSPGRSRAAAARGLRAAARESGGATRLLRRGSRVLARLDRAAPLLDFAFTVAWVQALALLVLGQTELLGSYLLLVVPLSVVGVALERRYHREVLDEAGLVLPRPPAAHLTPLLALDAVQAPVAAWERVRAPRERRPRRVRARPRLVPRGRPYA